jgi:hypothetical protein
LHGIECFDVEAGEGFGQPGPVVFHLGKGNAVWWLGVGGLARLLAVSLLCNARLPAARPLGEG